MARGAQDGRDAHAPLILHFLARSGWSPGAADPSRSEPARGGMRPSLLDMTNAGVLCGACARFASSAAGAGAANARTRPCGAHALTAARPVEPLRDPRMRRRESCLNCFARPSVPAAGRGKVGMAVVAGAAVAAAGRAEAGGKRGIADPRGACMGFVPSFEFCTTI